MLISLLQLSWCKSHVSQLCLLFYTQAAWDVERIKNVESGRAECKVWCHGLTGGLCQVTSFFWPSFLHLKDWFLAPSSQGYMRLKWNDERQAHLSSPLSCHLMAYTWPFINSERIQSDFTMALHDSMLCVSSFHYLEALPFLTDQSLGTPLMLF